MSLNVLIVDDSPVMRKMVLRTLELAGLPIGEVHQAGNGREGLDVLEENWVDVAFVDINMPVMNGEEMIDRLRENPALRDMPVVVVSTEGSETRIERLHEKGARFIHKPFSPEIVRGIVQQMIGTDSSDDAPEPTETPSPGDVSEMLQQVAEQTFESLAFILTMPEDEVDEAMGDQLLAEVSFDGPSCGTLYLAVPEGILDELSGNMLGTDGGTGREQQLDAMKELLNVICGNLLPAVAGAEAVFNVHAPSRPEPGSVPESLNGAAPAAVASLIFDCGKSDLALFVDSQNDLSGRESAA